MTFTLQEFLNNRFVYSKNVSIVELLVWLLWSCGFGLRLVRRYFCRGRRPRARNHTNAHTIRTPYHRFHTNFLKEETLNCACEGLAAACHPPPSLTVKGFMVIGRLVCLYPLVSFGFRWYPLPRFTHARLANICASFPRRCRCSMTFVFAVFGTLRWTQQRLAKILIDRCSVWMTTLIHIAM